jgi:hypothetical protein
MVRQSRYSVRLIASAYVPPDSSTLFVNADPLTFYLTMGDIDNMSELLTRSTAVKDNRDPRGIQWGIFPQTGRGLFLVFATKQGNEGKVVEDRKYDVPAECAGEWTAIHKAQAAIEKYLSAAWDMSEATAAKNKAARPQVHASN